MRLLEYSQVALDSRSRDVFKLYRQTHVSFVG